MALQSITSSTKSFAGVAPALSQVVVAILAALVVAQTADAFGAPEIINVVIIGLGAVGVWFAPLLAVKYGSWLKVTVSVLTAALVLLASSITDGVVTPVEWMQIVLAGFGAVGIAVGPTDPAKPSSEMKVQPLFDQDAQPATVVDGTPARRF